MGELSTPIAVLQFHTLNFLGVETALLTFLASGKTQPPYCAQPKDKLQISLTNNRTVNTIKECD